MYKHNLCLPTSLLIRAMIESDKDYLVLLGHNIANRRKKLMMTQADLAYKIGMEVPNLSVIENGKSNPQLLTLLRITAALQCELSVILPLIGSQTKCSKCALATFLENINELSCLLANPKQTESSWLAKTSISLTPEATYKAYKPQRCRG